MGTSDRIKQYLDYKGISKYAFYKKTGFSNKFLDNSSNMGTDRAEIILRYYDDISPLWLLTGEGNMIKTDQKCVEKDKKTVIADDCEVYKAIIKDKDLYIEKLNREIGQLQHTVELLKKMVKILVMTWRPNLN